MYKNVKANKLIEAANEYNKTDLTDYIKLMYNDTKPFATYVGMNTKDYEEFYFDVTHGYEDNWDLYSSHFEGNRLYLLYSAYENKKPSFKVLMNINTDDYSCTYDFFKYTSRNSLIYINSASTITHYRLESTLRNKSRFRISQLKTDEDLENLSHNFYYLYTHPKQEDLEIEPLKFHLFPTFISEYGYQVDDKEFICDAPHTTEEEIRKHLNNYGVFNQEQIEQVVNKKLAESYIDGENIYNNDEETINHHLKYKEHLNQKRRELIRVIQDNKKTNK